MTPPAHDAILIRYGREKIAPGDDSAPSVRLRRGAALRLADGPYPFPEPPDLIRIASVPDRLALLCEHAQSLCGVWDRPAREFLAAYFAFIAAALAAAEPALAAHTEAMGGLFASADWSFAALRPLPQGHVDAAAEAPPVRVDVAFWTGTALVAIDIRGSASPRRQRLDELQRIAAAGVQVIDVPAQPLRTEGAALLARVLPAPFQRFWEGVHLPRSPFGPNLDDIRRAD
jgi:hypothetical protein